MAASVCFDEAVSAESESINQELVKNLMAKRGKSRKKKSFRRHDNIKAKKYLFYHLECRDPS
jgi:cysteinyl-tRNA synthetase